jgi:hypothetical protein
LLATTALAAVITLGGAAHAGGPVSHFSESSDFGPVESNTTCSFPIQMTGHVEYWGTAFVDHDSNGNLNVIHYTEQDTFTGPSGKTLTGLPYKGTEHATDAVNTSSGFLELVPLNNGTLFKSTGRVDLTQPLDLFLVPDSGHAGDLAEFCAELAP